MKIKNPISFREFLKKRFFISSLKNYTTFCLSLRHLVDNKFKQLLVLDRKNIVKIALLCRSLLCVKSSDYFQQSLYPTRNSFDLTPLDNNTNNGCMRYLALVNIKTRCTYR